MRIAIIGDFHLLEDEWELSERAMDDVRNAAPDLVVALGDFGTYGNIGSPAGLEEAYGLLRRTGSPIRPILGNHDLERESGDGALPHGTMADALIRIGQLAGEDVYGVIELEKVRLLFISTEPQPAESCHQVQECYVSDRQFEELTALLEKRRGVPIIVFSHAPPMGSGLRTVPGTHVRSTNAYLDQNHDPERWMRWLRDYSEIVMWFSAHYHLSHHYQDSHTYRHGTHFFLTGVHGSCTRDGYRQSRLVDIGENETTVHTLDHERRGILASQSWSEGRTPAEWMLRKLLKRTASCPVGAGPLLRNGLLALPGQAFIAASEDGYSWEVRPEHEAVMGTLHVKAKAHALAYSEGRIWSAWGRWLGVCEANDPGRFVRKAIGGVPERRTELASPVVVLAAGPNGAVWFANDSHLWLAKLEAGEAGGVGEIALVRLDSLPGPAESLVADSGSCWLLSKGQAYRWNEEEWESLGVAGNVVDIKARDGAVTLLLEEGGKLRLLDRHGNGESLLEVPLPGTKRAGQAYSQEKPQEGSQEESQEESQEDSFAIRFLPLDSPGRRFLFMRRGRLYYWEHGWSEAWKLDTGEDEVVALALALGREGESAEPASKFAFVVRSGDDDPDRLELWESVRH
ncbi:metallophosphoesterase family protein [Cohnella fermenti]|uniref:Calcineurin-like phosphoesterase domain-containing protein n=1 Tax=Cohnella fermenti TaxID=2565925 RepID=A0A4S4BVI6_9BACL|nr:metallophosphoesterase [Cohnella fermenti]THF79132.1 hypothetical protein E6C55_13030 [Cohnella fermenti]